LDRYDAVTVRPDARVRVTVSGHDAGLVPLGEDHLVARAAVALGERIGVAPAVHLHIDKVILVRGWRAAALTPQPRWWPAPRCGPPIRPRSSGLTRRQAGQ
jgi:hypothetical protein